MHYPSVSRTEGEEKDHFLDDDMDETKSNFSGSSSPHPNRILALLQAATSQRKLAATETERPGACHSGLYAREEETKQLVGCYKNCLYQSATGTHGNDGIVLVTGLSGTGKTALARSLEPLVRDDGGYMIYGKCDQIHVHNNKNSSSNRVATATCSSVPYAPFAEAMSRLVEELLRQRDERTLLIRTRLRQAALQAEQEFQGQRARQEDSNIHTATTSASTCSLADMIPALAKLASPEQPISANTNNKNNNSSSSGSSSMDFTPTNTQSRPDLTESSSKIPPESVRLFCTFIRLFASPNCPLVLLLDDLQWLDSSSLVLFRELALEQQRSSFPGFLLIGTVRGNEVALNDPLAEALRCVEDNHVTITDIRLGNLTFEALSHLISDLLRLPNDQFQHDQVAQLVFQQTNGNIFFALQLIRSLHDNNILQYNETQQQWKWEPHNSTTNVNYKGHTTPSLNSGSDSTFDFDCTALIGTILDNVQQMSPYVEHVLKVTACLGAAFAYPQALAATGMQSTVLQGTLALLCEKGVLLQVEQDSSSYRWVHDRFQRVAYEKIPELERDVFHIRIGKKLLQHMSPIELQTNPFVVVNQLSRPGACKQLTQILFPPKEDGGDDMNKLVQRTRLAKLCLFAGEKASLSSAFESAATYFKLGIVMLGVCYRANLSNSDDCHHQEQQEKIQTEILESDSYGVAVNLYNAAAEMECCLGNFESVDALVALVVERPETLQEHKLRAYETKIYSLASRQDLDGCLRLGFKVMRDLLGERFPRRASFLNVATQVLKTKLRLSRVTDANFMALKPMRDTKKLAVARILHLIYPACSRLDPQLSVLIMTRGISLTLEYGTSNLVALFICGFSMICCHPIGDIKEGQRLGDIAMRILEKQNPLDLQCRTLLCYWGFTKAWTTPIIETVAPLKISSKCGNISGDIEMVCLSHYCRMQVEFLTGNTSLLELSREFSELHDLFESRHQITLLAYLNISEGAVACFRASPTKDFERQRCIFEENGCLEKARGVGDNLEITCIYLFKCLLAVYFHKPQEALSAAKSLRKCVLDAFTVILVYQAVFVEGFAELMAARSSGCKTCRSGKRAIKQLKKYEKHAPANVLNKILLLKALRAALRNDREAARARFQQSIYHAQQNGFLNEEALAHEQAGRIYMEWDDKDRAKLSLEKAASLYEQWGSPAKAFQMTSLLEGSTL